MCPEASDIFAAAAQLFPNRALMPAPADKRGVVRIDVSIRRTASGHEATAIVSGQYRAERRIVDPDWECRGLRDALAVSLLLAVETESTMESHTPPAHPQPDRLSAPVAVGQRRAAVSVEAGGMGTAGLLGRPALGGFIGSSLGLDNGVALSARGIRLVAQPTQEAGSDIQVDLWGVMAGPCWWAVMSSDWLVYPCLELGWGEQRGRASGIFRDASAQHAGTGGSDSGTRQKPALGWRCRRSAFDSRPSCPGLPGRNTRARAGGSSSRGPGSRWSLGSRTAA